MKIALTYTDGTSNEFVTNTYLSLGDRIAFERRFGISAAKMSMAAERLRSLVGEDGELAQDADPVAFEELREEWLIYFVWRAAQREIGPLPDFETWVDTLADWNLDQDTDVPVPTTAPALSG